VTHQTSLLFFFLKIVSLIDRRVILPYLAVGLIPPRYFQIQLLVKKHPEHLNGVACLSGWKGLKERTLFQHVGYQSVLTSVVTLRHNYDSLFRICSSSEFSCNLVDSNRLPRDIQKATRDFTTSIGEGDYRIHF
jgi:hypothetical protein